MMLLYPQTPPTLECDTREKRRLVFVLFFASKPDESCCFSLRKKMSQPLWIIAHLHLPLAGIQMWRNHFTGSVFNFMPTKRTAGERDQWEIQAAEALGYTRGRAAVLFQHRLFFLGAHRQLNIAEKRHRKQGISMQHLRPKTAYIFNYSLIFCHKWKKRKPISFCTIFILHLLSIYLFNSTTCFDLMSNFIPWKKILFMASKTDLFMFYYVCLQYISVVHKKREFLVFIFVFSLFSFSFV